MLALSLLALSLFPYAFGIPDAHTAHATTHRIHARNIVAQNQVNDTYDFVIVGGGTAGLVLASRLSEDSNTTVLVLEAGDTGDAVAGTVDTPGDAYYQSLLNSGYDWAYPLVAQPQANNRALTWARGKLLGGSSAINGMYYVRPSQIEVDAWANLMTSTDPAATSKWGWDTFYAAMKKSETFNAPSGSIQGAADIEFSTSSHGTSGPIHAGYPGYILPIVGSWIPTLSALGVPESPDAYGGQGWGSFIATSSINSANWTRSYARSGYIDPLPPRSNLQLLPNATVTRLIFGNGTSSNNLTATAVEYASSKTAAKKTVKVRKEVLLAGGTIGSPQVLMVSGVGPKDVLTAAGVQVLSELPGVGQHLQDHVSTQLVYKTTSQTAASMHTANNFGSVSGGSAAFLSFINSATAYVNLTTLLGNSAQSFQSSVLGAIDSSASSLSPSQDSTVLAGYKAIYNVSAQQFLSSPVGHIEILLSLTGTPNAGDQSIAVQVGLQHPFSQGQITIKSPDIFDYPTIDPRYLTHSADVQLLREGLKMARLVAQTAPLNQTLTGEVSPGSTVNSDADWEAWLANAVGTEFHPSGSCAMLPLNQGGVVDSDLRVYGLANVRVIDASAFPVQFAAHLEAPVYGLAEQAANMIRAFYNAEAPAPVTSSSASPAATQTQVQNSGTLGLRDGRWELVGSIVTFVALAASTLL
ncbi:GMC oxidoreductase [Dentipellis sp. KUC8613]|nr:GMC oxidoreductase [Dentipellis sp. KUC8613]